MEKHYSDYPRQRISCNNPYSACAYCGVSDPAINGQLENHLAGCEYRQLKELGLELELAKLEIECLKIDLQTVYCVALAEGSEGADFDTLKVFRSIATAETYKKELELNLMSDNQYVILASKLII
jgi:hypothetical protein